MTETPPPVAKTPAPKPSKKRMWKIRRKYVLWAVVFGLGYMVMSVTLLALRETMPFIGTGADTISILMAAILLPLAYGYDRGGAFQPGLRKDGSYGRVRKKLQFAFLVPMPFLLLGLSYGFLNFAFPALYTIGLSHPDLLALLYALLFLVYPSYLLGQILPLTANYFLHQRAGQTTGRLLLLFTLGAAFAGIFLPLVVMAFMGVHYAAGTLLIVPALLLTLIGRKKLSSIIAAAWVLAILGMLANSGYVMEKLHIVQNNTYNTAAVYVDDNGTRMLSLNNAHAAKLEETGGKYPYIEFVEHMALQPIPADSPKDILVIGAGAFTFGSNDTTNNYDFIDIDKTLRPIAEEYILKEQLTGNKTFQPIEARAYLAKTQKKYDVIFLDSYFGTHAIPEYLVTREFFQQVRTHLKEHGIVLASFTVSPNFVTKFSQHIDNTLRAAFPHVSRYVVDEGYDLWNTDPYEVNNVIYMFRNETDDNPGELYTDDKNKASQEHP